MTLIKDLENKNSEEISFIPEDDDEDDYTEYDSIGDIDLRNAKITKEINLSNLNTQQFEMVRKRLRLLSHLDRLNTFEELNGGYNTENAQKRFNSGEYGNFREQNIVEYAAEKARKGSGLQIFRFIFRTRKEQKKFRGLVIGIC